MNAGGEFRFIPSAATLHVLQNRATITFAEMAGKRDYTLSGTKQTIRSAYELLFLVCKEPVRLQILAIAVVFANQVGVDICKSRVRAHKGCLDAHSPKKDVVGCDKPREAAKQAVIRGFPNG